MISRLEELPNELLWFILEYIPSLDLFRAFLNLNQRFNTILRFIHFRFDLSYTNKNQFNYFVHTILPNIECNWIESYYIDDVYNRLYSIHICNNLRSLTIHHLRAENIDVLAKHVVPELKQLDYLRLYSEFILKDWDVNLLTNVILSEQMPSLTYCHLGFQDFGHIRFDHLVTNNRTLSLKSLVIDQWCRLRDFIQLLHFIPNIQRLTVRLFDSNTKGTIVPSLTTIDDFTTLVPHLVYLRAKLSQIPFSMATKILFLRLPSHLRELSLSTWSIEYADGDSWETLLTSKFPLLKHFRLIISLDQIPENHSIATNTDLDNIVKSFNQSKYFLNHYWNFLTNVNERDRLKLVIHTLPYPIENFQTTLYHIRRSTLSSSSIIKSAYRYVKKLTLVLNDDLIPLSVDHNEYRYFPNVNHLSFVSNLTSDCQQFRPIEYFHNLENMINLLNITSLHFLEETHQYPIGLINILIKNFPKLISLTISHRLFAFLKIPSINSLKSLTLIFAIYSSITPPVTRMRYLLPSNQILTNDLILDLAQTLATSFHEIQTLTLTVRDLDGFDHQFSEWLKENFLIERGISYDLLLSDKIVRFYF